MEIKALLIACLCYFALTAALPTTQKLDKADAVRDDAAAEATNTGSTLPHFASIASQKIALNMLKFNADIDANQVYSPLGISAILGVLAEGAAGETYDQFTQTLGFPAERSQLRASFQRILSRYRNREYSTSPSFQTWLYIYRNNTAREEFKQAIRENYFVSVKDIDFEKYDWDEPNTSLDLENGTLSNSKDIEGFETLKRLRTEGAAIGDLAAVATETQTQAIADNYGEEVTDKQASKFDRVVDDKQYVEKPAILDEIKENKAAEELKEKKENENVVEKENEKKKNEAEEKKEKEKEKKNDEVKKLKEEKNTQTEEKKIAEHDETKEQKQCEAENLKEKNIGEAEIEKEQKKDSTTLEKAAQQKKIGEAEIEKAQKKDSTTLEKATQQKKIGEAEIEKAQKKDSTTLEKAAQQTEAKENKSNAKTATKTTETAKENTKNIDKASEQLKSTAPATDLAEFSKQTDELKNKGINKREDDTNFEDNETVHSDEKLQKHYEEEDNPNSESSVPIKELSASNEPEKVTLPLQKLENALDTANKNAAAGEIMIALESHIGSVRRVLAKRSLFRKEDIATALSANSITGRETGAKTKMLLFNGLYYAGRWAQTFYKLNTDEENFFFMTAEDAMKAQMMQSIGKFYVADMEQLNAKVLCLPYENKKYALMIVLPTDPEGLRSLIDKLQPEDLIGAKAQAQEKELRITLPKFQVDETSRSEAMLKSIGLRKLFTRQESDLSLLSDDADLHVDEVVQFVSVRVDESGGSASGLSASNPQARTSGGAAAADIESLEVNRPFLYFVMDCEEEFVIAAGKIYNPEISEEVPKSIEVELGQV